MNHHTHVLPGVSRWHRRNVYSPSQITRELHTEPGFPDHSGSSRPHAGESIVDGRNMPGLILVGIAVMGVALTLSAAGVGSIGLAIVGAVVTVICLLAGTAWVLGEHVRVKHHEGLGFHDHTAH